jgi:predicted nucleic acid-binding protein
MKQYFADAWYFIAVINRFDAHHGAAMRLERGLRVPLLTHDAVLTEVLNFYCEDGATMRARTTNVVREALRSSRFEVLPAGRPLFLSALDRYAARPDKGYSLVDCMSMGVMELRGITHVLTNDHHFRQEGFVVVSDAP